MTASEITAEIRQLLTDMEINNISRTRRLAIAAGIRALAEEPELLTMEP